MVYPVKKTRHPGSSREELKQESDSSAHHRVNHVHEDFRPFGIAYAHEQHHGTNDSVSNEPIDGKETIRSILATTTDWKLLNPEHHVASRFILPWSEADFKQNPAWEVNKAKRVQGKEEEGKKTKEQPDTSNKQKHDEKEQKQGHEQDEKEDHSSDQGSEQDDADEYDGHTIAHPALAASDDKSRDETLFRALKEESEHMASLKQNDGSIHSPLKPLKVYTIDAADSNTPDNWIPRSDNLVRLTGSHPLNAEPDLQALFSAGKVTPNQLHYVRNHGAVPQLKWETHKLKISSFNDSRIYTMEELDKMHQINIQVNVACDGNRRKELNLIRRSKGFNWGCGGISCSFWKGVPLHLLLPKRDACPKDERWYVNFEGSEELSEGKYATSIPFEHAVDPTNDVILAMYMNDVNLPPDHGYPLRVIIPGFVGGRCVKWLARTWLSKEENNSHYHIYDNRVLPSFITEKDGQFADLMFHHPDTSCNEQNLQSVVVRPGHQERLDEKRDTYRISGYACDGGGHKVEKVEVSLDGGDTWLYATRTFPDYPIRHGRKYWTWVHWHVDVSTAYLMRASEITCRAWNVFKNTQPERPTWNLMGMMNNCYYRVRPMIDDKGVYFKHPVQPATDDSGWQQPSTYVQLQEAKAEAAGPDKEFTRIEIQKHNTKDSCWIVVNEKVFDATSVLSWHPGGAHAILVHAGKVHLDTTNEFNSIHDAFAVEKLNACCIGRLSKAGVKVMKEEAAKQKKASDPNTVLKTSKWVPAILQEKRTISHDTREYVFRFKGDLSSKKLGLAVGQHVYVAFHMKDGLVYRPYTPTNVDPLTFVIKTYYPSEQAPGGTVSNILDMLSIGEMIDMRGPIGEIIYKSKGDFIIEDKKFHFTKLNFVAGGSGVTPIYQLLKAMFSSKEDTKATFIFANKSEDDILLRDELERLAKEHKDRFTLCHVLSHPSDSWKGRKGYVDEKIIKEIMFPPGNDTAVFVCGPPPLILKAVMPAVKGRRNPLTQMLTI